MSARDDQIINMLEGIQQQLQSIDRRLADLESVEAEPGAVLGDWLSVKDVSRRLGRAEDTVRIWCASGVFPGATKATSSPQSHWRIPEDDVRNFGTQRAVARTTSLDHKRRQELMAAHRSAA